MSYLVISFSHKNLDIKQREKLAILELILSQDKDEDFDINSYLEEFKEKNKEDVNSMKKGLYMEFSGEIISRLDS